MPTQSESPNWEALMWGIIIAGCYDRRKNQCEKTGDAELIEQWERAAAEKKEKQLVANSI